MGKLQFDLRDRGNLQTLKKEAAAKRVERGRGEKREKVQPNDDTFTLLLAEIINTIKVAPDVLDRESGETFNAVRKLFDRGSRLSRQTYEATRAGKTIVLREKGQNNA